jgi:hypothetical protein
MGRKEGEGISQKEDRLSRSRGRQWRTQGWATGPRLHLDFYKFLYIDLDI